MDEHEPDVTIDATIDAVLAGRADRDADPAVLWLATALRPPVPAALEQRLAAALAASSPAPSSAPSAVGSGVSVRPRPAAAAAPVPALRWAAALLAAVFWVHGLGSVLVGDWVGRRLGEDAPHVILEGGVTLLAVATFVAAGALRREWLPVAVAGGVPLGLFFGLHGIREYGTFAAGALLHTLEGLSALLLLVLFVRELRRRRVRDPGPDDDRPPT